MWQTLRYATVGEVLSFKAALIESRVLESSENFWGGGGDIAHGKVGVSPPYPLWKAVEGELFTERWGRRRYGEFSEAVTRRGGRRGIFPIGEKRVGILYSV